ncbi:DEAD-domain-containing protein [Piedraia hortae CBS 480.64]|uniref:RNA helicase n=1 Tax=Piedraia hortae CBS 480.64 TaxID=1314780 RepID=A0A6A7BUZ6_9PEZI|nr:DEAD-domain-containing protein [Piedraia hortae CBS 480.64]
MKRKHEEAATEEATAETPVTPTFANLHLDPQLLQAIAREKLVTPTPVQVKTIPIALQGQHALVRAKTGSGKTLAYALPILHDLLKRNPSAKKRWETTALILVPTKELAGQVALLLKPYLGSVLRCESISRKEDSAVTRARLMEKPDIVIATPGRVTHWINQDVLSLKSLRFLVIDEADLVLSYGYEEDIETLAAALPSGVQKLIMSATLRTEIDALTKLLFPPTAQQPTILDLSAEEAEEKPALAQYVASTAEEDKFLLIYAIFKLRLIKGKAIVFVADTDRCYRVKLFLEQFGIRSCILNSELPANTRLHAVQEFNRGVYDIIIAADENEIVGEERQRKRRKVDESEEKSKKKRDKEFGISRGIDFRLVTCVLNFDLPTSVESYTHRVGRTARAGKTGIALSFYVPKELYRKHKPTSIEQCQHDEKVLAEINEAQGPKLEKWQFDMSKLEGLRYRFGDALRAVTRIAVREARTKELRHALINSERLKRHFEEHPDELQHLRHDVETHAVRVQPELKDVPDYLLPAGGKAAVAKDVGYVTMRKDTENRLRKRISANKKRGKQKGKMDPLKTLNARGRKK